jgi:3-hydroxyethyl bacteriochlorophyllide a dehydrogenase
MSTSAQWERPYLPRSSALSLETTAVIFERARRLSVGPVGLLSPGADDCVVDIEWSGISTGTERLLWTGQMPDFPGMGYPLVPGYESVGRVVSGGEDSGFSVGERVFVPGSRGFAEVRGLFGGAAARVVAPAARLIPLGRTLAEEGVLLALAATAYHALAVSGRLVLLPDLIVGHGVLGRLIARLIVALEGPAPRVWEKNPARRDAGNGYAVIDPDADERRDYRLICDVSGDARLCNELVSRLARGGQIVLAGFYDQALSFDFAPAFMREVRLQVAAEWQPDDLRQVMSLLHSGRLSLDGLITHRETPARAAAAYHTAFEDAGCLKMILDWRSRQ